MKRILIWLGLGLGALALLLVLAFWWLTATRGGASFLLARATGLVETLEFRHVQGGLGRGMVLEDVVLRQGGFAVDADRVELAARIGLLPLAVTIERLHIDGLELRLPPADPDAPESEPLVLGDYRAPFPVELQDLVVRDLVLQTGPDAEPIQLQRLALAGRYAQALEIDRLELKADPLELTLHGALGLDAPWRVDVRADAVLALDSETRQSLGLQARGPLADLALEIKSAGPARFTGRSALSGLPEVSTLQAELDLEGGFSNWPGIDGEIDALTIVVSGGLEHWQAAVGGLMTWPGVPPAQLQLAARGTPASIEIDTLQIDTLDGHIGALGRIGLEGESPNASARLVIEELDFTALYPDWPAQARVSGEFEAVWDGQRLRVEPLRLVAPPTPLTLTGRIGFASADQTLDLNLEWRELRWPPVLDESDEPLFSSRSGSFSGSGNLADWQAELDGWLRWSEVPEARLELDAEGGADSAQLRSGRVDFGNSGVLALAGQLGWAEGLNGTLQLQLEAFDPAVLIAELPGTIDADLGLRLDSTAPLAGRIDIDQLQGRLRQVPLSGSGQLLLAGTEVGEAALRLDLGENRLTLDRQPGSPWKLVLDAKRLDQLWPELIGSVMLEAELDPDQVRASWRLEGPALAWQEIRASALDSSGSLRWGAVPEIEARLRAAKVDLNPWERLERVELQLAGGCAEHRFGAFFTGTRATLDMTVRGMLPNCLDAPRSWSGAVEKLQIDDTPVGQWQLDQPLPIELAADGRVRAGPGCLWTISGPGRLCLTALDGGSDGSAEIALNSVPIDMLLLAADPVFTLGSELRGLARVAWMPGGLRSIDATLLLGPGAVRMLESEDDLLRIRGAELVLDSPEAGALNAHLQLDVEQQSQLVMRAEIPDLNTTDSVMIDARADLSLPNLGAFNRLVPQLDRMGGRLEAGMDVRGPLAAPKFDGQVAIHDGAFLYAPLGSRIESLELMLDADRDGGRVDGSFKAGEGQGWIEGRIGADADDQWQGQMALRGSALQLFDVDWMKLTISPDLDVGFTSEQFRFDGLLSIDKARIGLPPGAEQRVAVSDDVVILNGGASSQPSPPPSRPIQGELKLRLGDDVRLQASGMETRLAGALDIEWAPGAPLPAARGLIRLVDGSYRAFGQNLEVTEGDVLFTGNPIDNPMLSVEAVRTIFGDAQVEQAGVRIAGPAQNPDISLFTSPPTSREKALAYVLTGADFDHAGGQGAFSVGFWVLPQLFVSYGLGLFDSGNVLAARYELSRRWGLRATSGERDTGADISFIIDR